MNNDDSTVPLNEFKKKYQILITDLYRNLVRMFKIVNIQVFVNVWGKIL